MRLITYFGKNGPCLGALLDNKVVDVQLAYQKFCQATNQPPTWSKHYGSMLELLQAGQAAMIQAAETIRFVQTSLSVEKERLRVL